MEVIVEIDVGDLVEFHYAYWGVRNYNIMFASFIVRDKILLYNLKII